MTDPRAGRYKASPSSLAIHGGQPAFAEPLHVGRPNIGDRDTFLKLVGDVLDRAWLTNDGPLVREFEQRIADYLGVRNCVAMCNGTIALEITIRALGLTGEVIVPSYTFIATAHALHWQGITPVFADIDPSTHDARSRGGPPDDHAPNDRHHRSAPVGPCGASRGVAGGRRRTRPAVDVRRRSRLRLQPWGPNDRSLRSRGGAELPCHQVLQHVRGWRCCHRRR